MATSSPKSSHPSTRYAATYDFVNLACRASMSFLTVPRR